VIECYRTLCSVSDNRIHLICREGESKEMPDHVRHQDPGQVMPRGEIAKLKRTFRVRLAAHSPARCVLTLPCWS
jgi:hypothetical protein